MQLGIHGTELRGRGQYACDEYDFDSVECDHAGDESKQHSVDTDVFAHEQLFAESVFEWWAVPRQSGSM